MSYGILFLRVIVGAVIAAHASERSGTGRSFASLKPLDSSSTTGLASVRAYTATVFMQTIACGS